MRERLAIARALTWTPDTNFYERDLELDAQGGVELFSPTGHRCELSMNALRVLSSFGTGATIDEVCGEMKISAEERPEVLQLVEVLKERGLLRPADQASMKVDTVPPTCLVSAHGCGATLIRWLLDAHPLLACPSPNRLGLNLREMIIDAQQRGAFSSWGMTAKPHLRALGVSIDRLLGLHARRRQKDHWVWASRDHDKCLRFVDQIFDHRARFIVAVRHPFDAAESSARRQEEHGWRPERMVEMLRKHETPQLAYAHYWVDVFSRVSAFQSIAGERMLVVKYEDVVKNPEREAARMCEFLGVPIQDRLSEEAFRRAHEVLDGGWESQALLGAKGINADQIGSWRGWTPALKEQVSKVVANELPRWGYEG